MNAESNPNSFNIARQPDEITCGPTCLHAIYQHFKSDIDLPSVIQGVQMLKTGGTLAPFLGTDALLRGYQAEIYSFNVKIFDPTWFKLSRPLLIEKLSAQASATANKRRYGASLAYMNFLAKGGHILFEDLSVALLRQLLFRRAPILVGLSATFLYKAMREHPVTCADDDIEGDPTGHFVVCTGPGRSDDKVAIADPFFPNALSESPHYEVTMEHLICAILLGVVTYDANLLIITRPAAP